MKLREWIKHFENQFSDRDLELLTVHKVSLAAQLKDTETGNLHLHNMKFTAKDAIGLSLLQASEPDVKTTGRRGAL